MTRPGIAPACDAPSADAAYTGNVTFFGRRFPELAAMLTGIDSSTVGTGRAADGGLFLGVRAAAGKWSALTNPQSPLAAAGAAVEKMKHRLGAGQSPAVIVGLQCGYELEIVFNHFLSRLRCNEPFRRIYVVVTSLHCLCGWLKICDRRCVLERPEVAFVWHENVSRIVQWCCANDQRSHLFIPVSVLPDDMCNVVLAPLADLYIERQEQQACWHRENQAWYDALTDDKLVAVLRGRTGRKPRVLMPTHGSSTVVQYSARDTCAAFESLGWDARILLAERDLPGWRVVREIHDFKPDVLVFINHLRTEDADIYPDNLFVITWVQDTVSLINRTDTASAWNATASAVDPGLQRSRHRDLIVGYVRQIKKYGYLEDRLCELSMIVNTRLIRPRTLTQAEKRRFTCDVCFASNAGKPTDLVIHEELAPVCADYGIDESQLQAFNRHLWERYRDGSAFTTYPMVRAAIAHIPGLDAVCRNLANDDRDYVVQRLFWQLNDKIYRQVVLEWCIELGMDVHLYGRDWDRNPVFARYARGIVAHGNELSAAYQAARYCLHLNSVEGAHQRLWEIVAAGGTPLIRRYGKKPAMRREVAAALRKILGIGREDGSAAPALTPREQECFNDFLFVSAEALRVHDPAMAAEDMQKGCDQHVLQRLRDDLTWLLPESACRFFRSRDDLEVLASETDRCVAASDVVGLVPKLNDNRIAVSMVDHMLTLLDGGADRASAITLPPSSGGAFELAVTIGCPTHSGDALDAIRNGLMLPGAIMRFEVAEGYIRQGRVRTAIELIEKVDPLDLDSTRIVRFLIRVAELQGPEASSSMISDVYRRDSDTRDLFSRVGWGMHQPMWRFDACIPWFRRDDDRRRSTGAWRMNWAKAMAAVGEFQAAGTLVRDCYATDPLLTNGYALIGEGAWFYGDFDRAYRWFRKDHALGRLDPAGYLNLAKAALYRDDVTTVRTLIRDHALPASRIALDVRRFHVQGRAPYPDYHHLIDLVQSSLGERGPSLPPYTALIVLNGAVGDLASAREAAEKGGHLFPDRQAGLTLRLAAQYLSAGEREKGQDTMDAIDISTLTSAAEQFNAAVWSAVAGNPGTATACLQALHGNRPDFFVHESVPTATRVMWYGLATHLLGHADLSARCLHYATVNTPAFSFWEPFIKESIQTAQQTVRAIPEFVIPYGELAPLE